MRIRGIGVAAASAGLALGLAGAAAMAADQAPVNKPHDTVESAAESPVEDLNLKRTPIPEVLVRAMANPYDLRTMDKCVNIAAEVVRIDEAIGPDKDAPPPADNRTLNEKRGDTAATALKTGVEWLTPYRGIVRTVSGASAYEKKIRAAVEAGQARRGFLKGMALKMNCAPPASPAWYKVVYAQPAAAPARTVRRR